MSSFYHFLEDIRVRGRNDDIIVNLHSLRPVTRGQEKISPIHPQAGLLTYRSPQETAFPIAQWHISFLLPIYSDEFVQDLHLFPFSPVQT